MSTDDSVLWMHTPPAPTKPRPGELLFEFISTDGAPMSCELQFHGESYGWEARFFKRGELLCSHGGFPLRALAVQWADQERGARSPRQR